MSVGSYRSGSPVGLFGRRTGAAGGGGSVCSAVASGRMGADQHAAQWRRGGWYGRHRGRQGATRARAHTRREARHRIPTQAAARPTTDQTPCPTTTPPIRDSIRSVSALLHVEAGTVASAREGFFENQRRKEGNFRPCNRFPSRAADREPGNATLAPDRPPPSCTNPNELPETRESPEPRESHEPRQLHRRCQLHRRNRNRSSTPMRASVSLPRTARRIIARNNRSMRPLS